MNNDKIPTSWANIYLNDVGKWGSGGTPSRRSAENYGGDIKWLKTGELGPKVVHETEEKITENGLNNSSAKIFEAGCIAIAMYGATIGKISILGCDMATNQACAVISIDEEVMDRNFLYHFLSSQKEAFANAGQGGAQPNISQKVIKEWPLPLPPKNEQRRIVDKLDTTLAAVEACKQKLIKASETIERFRQSVLAAAVSGELTREWRQERGIDRNDWKSTTFGEICSQITVGFVGKMSDQYKETGIPFLRSMNIKPFRLKEDGILFISSEFHQKIIKSKLLPGDLAVVRTGEPGQCCVIPDFLAEANCSDLVVLRPGDELVADFGAIAINSSSVKQFVNSEKVGVAQAHFNVGSMKITPLELPSLDEQTAISEQVSNFQNTADEIQEIINKNQEILTRLSKSLLAKAFRGELIPQDPNDEPATELLRGIKARRETEAATRNPARRSSKKKADAAQLVIPKGIANNHLTKVLEECGALSERALLAASGLEPNIFEVQLGKEKKEALIVHNAEGMYESTNTQTNKEERHS